jgi:hypothetical protein
VVILNAIAKILFTGSFMLMLMFDIHAQPHWVPGTPSVMSTGPFSLNLSYGIDVEGTVYVIVYSGNNTALLTSSYVRSQAILRTDRGIIETATLSVNKSNLNRILNAVLNVPDPDQVYTIYVVAANRKNVLQAMPVRLNATTLPCPQANAGDGGNECDLNFVLNAVSLIGNGTWTRVSGPGNAIFSPNASTPPQQLQFLYMALMFSAGPRHGNPVHHLTRLL